MDDSIKMLRAQLMVQGTLLEAIIAMHPTREQLRDAFLATSERLISTSLATGTGEDFPGLLEQFRDETLRSFWPR